MIGVLLGVVLGGACWAFWTAEDRDEAAASLMVVFATLIALALLGIGSVAGASSFRPPAGVERSPSLDVYQRWLDRSRVKAPAQITIALRNGADTWELRSMADALDRSNRLWYAYRSV
jgi:hypothetical protein